MKLSGHAITVEPMKKETMKVIHLLMAFGNKNQSYTTDLLEKLSFKQYKKTLDLKFYNTNYLLSSKEF